MDNLDYLVLIAVQVFGYVSFIRSFAPRSK